MNLVATLFLDSHNYLPQNFKLYDYLIDDKLLKDITVGPTAMELDKVKFKSYQIINNSGYNYRGSLVLFVAIKPVDPTISYTNYKEIKAVTENLVCVCTKNTYESLLLPKIEEKLRHEWYRSISDYLIKIFNEGSGMINTSNATNLTSTTTSSSTTSSSATITSNTGTGLQYDGNHWVTTAPYTTCTWTYPNYVTPEQLNDLTKRVEKLEKNKKEKPKMFENLTKNLKCGRAQDVRLSIYGPAFKGEDGNWYSVDIDGQMTDVSDLLFDMDSYCFMMPVAKNSIKVGDFILHNNHWLMVIEYENGCIVNAVDIFNKQFVTPTVTKSPFGFEFYTKLVQLLDFSKMPVNADNPFGMMPIMLMMNNKNDKDMLPMLMMMSAQNGNLGFDMSNPLMMYLLMKDGDNSIIPFLAMGTFKSAE